MKRIFIVVILLIGLLAYSGEALDELLDQSVIISPQSPEISSIIERIDEAKNNGDVVLFRQLLSEYKELNPPLEVKDGPQVEYIGIEHKSRWTADDIEVDSAYGYQEFSMDTRNDSRIYLAASRQLTSADDYRIPVWYSDDGITWTYYCNLFWVDHHLYNPSLKIVETPDTDYIFVAFEAYDRSSPYDYDVLVYRRNLVSEASIYYYAAYNSSIDEMDPSLDADDVVYPSLPYLHLAFESGDSVAYIRSLDLGATWVDRAIIGAGAVNWDYYDPSLAYGPSTPFADSMNLGVAWTYYQVSPYVRRIRFKRNRDKGLPTAWLSTEYFSAPDHNFDDRPSLKMTHGVMNSAIIVFARRDTTGTDQEDLCNFFTYDAARTCDEDILYWGGDYEVLTTLAVDDAPNDFHVFFKGDNDDIRYKEAHYDDFSYSGWTGSMPISAAGDISDVSSPASAVLDTQPCVCWKTYAPGWKLMFDALWLQTGVEEEPDIPTDPIALAPNPSNGIATLSYSVEKEGNVRISLHDVTGRLIKSLLNENKRAGIYSLHVNNKDLPSGIYFLHVSSPDGVYTRSMTVIR